VKYLLDTNVYLRAFLSDAERERFRVAYLPLLPATMLSAVVAYELDVDAANRLTRERLAEFVAPMTRAGRVVTPARADWETAAGVVTNIRERESGFRSKLPALLNDVLIALCARQVGAKLFTYNRDDFELIHRHLTFELQVLR
jgi:predicted nucleic acid-binding protein